MTFIQYPFPIHDQNEPPAKGPGMSNREALARIRPRTRRDKMFLLWAIIFIALGIAATIALSHIIHLDAKNRRDIRITTAPAAYH